MKVTLNLAISPGPRERYALAWAAPVTLLALGGFVLLCVSATRNLIAYRSTQRDRLNIQKQEAALSKNEIELRKDLDQQRLRGVVREAQFVNTLIDRKQVSLSVLMGEVTQLLPGSVRLTSMVLSEQGGDRVVRFVVTGTSEEALENFLINLEGSPDFRDVTTLNQGIEGESAAGGQVSLTCTVRYLGGEQR